MSWAADEWKDGLPQKALIKISQIESQFEWLKKDRDQKQFQLGNLEQALEAQKQKGSNEKSQLAELKRENQQLTETCQELEKKKQKLTNDLLMKENQVACLEQKVVKLNGQHDPGKISDLTVSQAKPDEQHIKCLEQEIAELRQQLEDKNGAAANSLNKKGDELANSKAGRHLTDDGELRKTQQELRVSQSLVAELEIKNKKLIQDIECMRHNAEASRLHLETKMKEHERELKQDTAQALETAKNAERVLQESKAKWQQEMNACLAEQNRLKGFLEKQESEKAALQKGLQEMKQKANLADQIIKTNGANVAEIERKKAALEAEKEKLVFEVDGKDREIQTLGLEIQRLKNENAQKEQTNDSLRAKMLDKDLECESSRAEAERLSQKILQTENQLMDTQKQKEKAEDIVKQMSASACQVNKEKETLEKTNAELTSQLQKLQESVNRTASSLQATLAQLSEKERQFKDSHSKWMDTEINLQKEISQSTAKMVELSERESHLNSVLSAKDKEIVELKDHIESNGKLVSSKDFEITLKDKNIADLEKQLQAQVEMHETFKHRAQEQEMDLKEKLDQAEMSGKKKLDELERLSALSVQEKSQLQKDCEQLLREKQQLEDALKTCSVQCDNSMHLITTLENKRQMLKERLGMKRQEMLEMNSMLEKYQLDFQKKVEEVEILGSQVNQRDQHISNLSQASLDAEKRLHLADEEISTWNDKCQKLEEDKVSLLTALNELKAQNDCMKQVAEANESQMKSLRDQLEATQNECSLLQKRATAETEKSLALEKEVHCSHDSCSDLESKILRLTAEVEEKTRAASKLEETCSCLSGTLEVQKQEMKTYIDQLTALESRVAESDRLHVCVVEEMSNKLHETLKESSQFKGALEQKEDKISELQKEITKLQCGIAFLESSHVSLKAHLEAKTCELSALEEKCASLSDELEEANKRLVEEEQLVHSRTESLRELEQRVKQQAEEAILLKESSCKELESLQVLITELKEDLHQKAGNLSKLQDYSEELKAKLSFVSKEMSDKEAERAQEEDLLKSRLDVLQMDVEDKDAVLQDLNTQLANLNSVLGNVTQERDRLKEMSLLAETELNELRATLEGEKSKLLHLQSESDTLNTFNKNLQVALESSQSHLTSKTTALQELELSLEKAQKLQAETVEQLQACLKEEEKLLGRIASLDQALSAEKEIHLTTVSESEELRKKLVSVSDDLESLKCKLLKEQEDGNAKAGSLRIMECKIQELQEAKALCVETASGEMEHLQGNLQLKEQLLSETNIKLQELEHSCQDLRARLHEAKGLALEKDADQAELEAKLRSQLDLLQMDIDDKDDTMQELNTKLSNLELQVAGISLERDSFKEMYSSIHRDISDLKTALEEEKVVAQELRGEGEITKDKMKNAEAALAELKAMLAEKELTSLQLQLQYTNTEEMLAKCQKEVVDCQKEKEKLIMRIDDLEKTLALEKASFGGKCSELELLNVQCISLSDNLDKLNAELEFREEKLNAQAQSLHEMESTLKELDAEKVFLKESSEEELDRFQQKLAEAEKDLCQKTCTIEHLENQLADFRSKLSDTLKQNSEKNDEHNEETALLKSKLEMMQMDIQDKDAVIQDLTNKISNLTSQVDSMTQRAVSFETTSISFETQLVELNLALDAAKEATSFAQSEESSLKNRVKYLETTLTETRQELEERETALNQKNLELVKTSESLAWQESISAQFKEDQLNLRERIEELKTTLALEKEACVLKVSELEVVNRDCVALAETLASMKEELFLKGEEISVQTQSLRQMEVRLSEKDVEKTQMQEASENKLEMLQQQLHEAEEELKKKASKIEDLENRMEDLKGKLDAHKLQSENIDCQDKEVAELRSQLNVLRMDMNNKDSTIHDLNTNISNMTCQLERVAQEVHILQTAKGASETEVAELNSALEGQKITCAQMKSKEERLKEKIQNLETTLTEIKAELEAKEKSLQDLHLECEKAGMTLVHHEGQMKDREDEKIRFVSRIEDLQRSLALEREVITSITSELEMLQQRCDSLSGDLVNSQAEVLQREAELQTKLQSLLVVESKLNQAEKEKNALQESSSQELEKLQSLLQEREEILKQKSSRIEELENCFEDLKVKLSDLVNEQSKANAESGQEAIVLQSHLDLLQTDLANKESLIQEMFLKVSNLNALHEVITQDRGSLNIALQLRETEYAQVSSALQDERDAHADSKKTMEILQERVSSLETTLSTSKIASLEKEMNLHEMETECDKAKQTLSENQTAILKHEQKMEMQHCIILDLEQKLGSQQTALDNNASEKESLFNQCSSLQEKLLQAESELSKKEEELRMLSQGFQDLQTRLCDLETSKKSLEETLTSELDQLQKQLCQKEDDLKQKTELLDELQTQLTDLQSKFSDKMREKKIDEVVQEKESTTLANKLDECRRDLEEKNNLLEALGNEVSNLKNALSSSTSENEAMKASVSCLETEQSLLQESYEALQVIHARSTAEVERLQEESRNMENKFQQQKASLETKEQQVIKLETQLNEMVGLSEELQLTLRQQTEQIRILEMANKELDHQVKSLTLEKSDLSKCSSRDLEHVEMKLTSVQEELDAKSTELESLKTHHDNMNRSLMKTNAKCMELQSEMKALTEQYQDMKTLYDEAMAELQEKSNMVCVLRKELDSSTCENDILRSERCDWLAREEKYKQDTMELDSKVSDLEIEIESTRESFESVSHQRFEAQNKLRESLRGREHLEEQLKNMEGLYSEVQAQTEQVESLEVAVEGLKQKLLQKEEELSDYKGQLDAVCCEQRSGKMELDLLQRQKAELETSLREASGLRGGLEERLSEFTGDTKEVKEQLAQLQRVIQKLNKSLDSKQKELVESVNEISKKEDDITKLQTLVEEKESAITEMSQKISRLEKELKEAKSTVGTFEDAIESLNFELSAAEEHKASLESDNNSLKTKIKELEVDVEMMKREMDAVQKSQTDSESSLETQLAELEKQNAEYVDMISSLTEVTAGMKVSLQEKSDALTELTQQMKSVNQQLDEKVSEAESLSLQVQTTETEIKSLQRLSEDQEKNLSKVRESEKALLARVVELDYEINMLNADLTCKNEEIKTLTEKEHKLSLKCEQLNTSNAQLVEEKQHECHMAGVNRKVLEDRIQELVADQHHSEEKATHKCEKLLRERDELKERSHHLEQVELEKTILEQKLEESLAMLEEKSEKTEEALQEIEALKKKLEMEKELLKMAMTDRDAVSEKLKRLEEELKLLENIVPEKNNMKEKVEELTAIVNQKNKLEKEAADKNEMEEKLQNLQAEKDSLLQQLRNNGCAPSNDTNKELLQKWEQKCSELNNIVIMERRKVKRLTEQVESLKSTHMQDNGAEIQKLTTELQETTEERDTLKEKFNKTFEAAERHFNRAKELERLNERLSSRNKLLNHLMKQKGSGTVPVKNFGNSGGNSVPKPLDVDTSSKQKNSIPEVAVPDSSKITISTDATSNAATLKSLPDINKPGKTLEKANQEKLVEDLIVTTETSLSSNNSTKMNAYPGISGSPHHSSRLPRSPQQKCQIQNFKLATPLQSPLRKKISPSSTLANLKMQTPVKSESTELKFKPNTPRRTESLRAAASLLSKPLQSPSSSKQKTASATDSGQFINISKPSPSHNDGSRKTSLELMISTKVSEESNSRLSPRVTRRMSLLKRKSMDQSQDPFGGKKSKLAFEGATTELSSPAKSKNAVPKRKLPQLIRSKTNQTSGMLMQSKKEDLASGKVLATITNSPKKVVTGTRGSLRPRGLQRLNKSPDQKKTSKLPSVADEGPSQCQTQ